MKSPLKPATLLASLPLAAASWCDGSPSLSGVRPDHAIFNDEGECGTAQLIYR